MKKIILLLFVLIYFSSCGVSVYSVVNDDVKSTHYNKPLILIPYQKGQNRSFSKNLEEKLYSKFNEENQQVDIIIFEREKQELSLNSENEVNDEIIKTIDEKNIDLILVFNLTEIYYMNGTPSSQTYEIVAHDVKTKVEVWNAKFKAWGVYGPSAKTDKSARVLYDKLKSDKIL